MVHTSVCSFFSAVAIHVLRTSVAAVHDGVLRAPVTAFAKCCCCCLLSSVLMLLVVAVVAIKDQQTNEIENRPRENVVGQPNDCTSLEHSCSGFPVLDQLCRVPWMPSAVSTSRFLEPVALTLFGVARGTLDIITGIRSLVLAKGESDPLKTTMKWAGDGQCLCDARCDRVRPRCWPDGAKYRS